MPRKTTGPAESTEAPFPRLATQIRNWLQAGPRRRPHELILCAVHPDDRKKLRRMNSHGRRRRG